MDCKVEKADNKAFYTTTEDVKRCFYCKRDYKKRKTCKKCERPLVPYVKERTGWISLINVKDHSCDCQWNSFWRWSEFWKNKFPESNCKHYKISLKKLKDKGFDKNELA